MSSNDMLVILKKKDKFEIHHNHCVDNDFKPDKTTLIKKERSLNSALQFAEKYCIENMVEYNYNIDSSCFKRRRK